jgi:GNAT superfamily N-acetyltransferase
MSDQSAPDSAGAAPVRIRRAAPDDAPAIAAVDAGSGAAAFRGLLPERYLANVSVAGRAERWRVRLADPESRAATWVAEDVAGTVVGFCHVGPSPDDGGEAVGHLHALYVLPEWAGRGIGSALLAVAVAALAADFAEATLWVLAGNAPARTFYEARGWRPDGAESEDAVVGGFAVSVRYRRRLR